MDGIELNLFQGNKIVKKKNSTKSKKLFMKKKINRIKKTAEKSKSFKKKIEKPKKEINQNKEISTIQDEFSSGLDTTIKKQNDQKNDSNKGELKKINQKVIKKDKITDSKIEQKSFKGDNLGKSYNQPRQTFKVVKAESNSFENKSSSNDKQLEPTRQIENKSKEKSPNKTNQRTISIMDEFSDGLTSLKRSSMDERKRKSTDDLKRNIPLKKPNRTNDSFSKEHSREQRSESSDLSKNDLKSDFNKLFTSKGKMTQVDYEKLHDKSIIKPKKRFNQEEENRSNDRKGFISNLFRSNPEIPEVRLRKLSEENKEKVFNGEQSFELFKDRIHPHLISCLSSRLNIHNMTNVQFKSIPLILERNDCLIKSVTGSGKSVAYILPIVQRLQEKVPKITRADGIHALVIVPTRELVMQCYNVFENLCKAFTFIVPGYLMGGEKKHSEKQRIRKGINILVATPGRLLDHMATTKSLSLDKIEMLVIDEADRMYEAGFEESIKNIFTFINEQKQESEHIQTILLSATLSTGVRNLAGMALNNPILIDTFDEDVEEQKYSFPKNLKQYFCLVPAKLRLLTLASFIFKNCSFEKSSKVIIFVSTQDIVDFHYNLFSTTFNGLIKASDFDEINFFRLHGNMDQKERMNIFQQFKQTRSGVLISTSVSSRGLDLNEIEYVIQYTCPSSIEDYIHRIGRTARVEHNGSSLIFLLPSEFNFLKYIQKELEANLIEMKVDDILKVLMSFTFGKSKPERCFREHASKLQFEFESAIHGDEAEKLKLARKAYLSFVRAYATHPKLTKSILPFKELHLGHLCKSFGLRDAPRTLSNFKQEFTKKVHQNPTEKFISKFANNSRIFNKRMIPTEKKYSEFDSGV